MAQRPADPPQPPGAAEPGVSHALPRPRLHRVSFADIAGWPDDDHQAALAAFRTGAASAPAQTGALGVEGERLRSLARLAGRTLRAPDRRAARSFFEQNFVPHRIESAGFLTGYYEPDVAARRVRADGFEVPLYRRPHDLPRPDANLADLARAEAGREAAREYFDRAAIEDGALAGRGLELAWLKSAVDAFFIHVQGSARLRLAGGETMRIGFDGKSGHPYTSIGRLAVARGILPSAAADRDGLAAWLTANPEEGRALMRENRSFIFFREVALDDKEGPIGVAGSPLLAGRSLAVDRAVHTFGTPIWIDAPDLDDAGFGGAPFRRLVVAHDTGSAIVGPARGDIFFGSGAAAGSRAGRVRHAATLTVLAPAAALGGR